MERDEIIARLHENIHKIVRVRFTGDAKNPVGALRYSANRTNSEEETARTGVRDMTVMNLDDEGFVNQIDGELFWSTFDDVENVEPLPPN